GSTFKIVTAAMALEESLVRPGEGFYCAGSTHVAGWDIHCWKTADMARWILPTVLWDPATACSWKWANEWVAIAFIITSICLA
ncbi:MAG: hypothetical protein IKU11_01840, partial [Clostridia bacterium]|nr:hypothetical protein [Clostridia bacterium]